jgi:PAS domain S-box-containing protein
MPSAMETESSAPKISAPQRLLDRNIFQYGLALGSVALALGVGLWARHYGIGHQFAVLLFAVAVAGWNGGLGPAVVAAVFSSLAYDYFFTAPLYQLGWTKYDLIDLALYILFAFLITWFREVRWRTEGKLRASEQKYRELIDASPDAIFVWDKDGNCVLSNASAARLCGCAENELTGLSIADTYLAYERDRIRERFDRARREGVFRFERQFLRKDNHVVPVEVSLSTAGEGHYQAVVRDITDRKRAERELRKQAELLSLAHDAIIVRDPKSRITFWNPGAEKAYGWSAAEAMGKVTHELLQTTFPEPLDQINAMLLRTGRWEGELIHTKRDGRRVVVASRQSLRRDEHGAPAAILEINRDVTDRKRAEQQIRKLNQDLEQRVIERTSELEAVNKELEAFAYSVSHDLRAPVRHIAGFTELLQKHAVGVLDDKSRHQISMILDAANRMGTLVDDLLAFSRIGRAQTQNTTVDLSHIVKGVIGEFAADTQGRKIVWRVGDLPKCYGDPAMLRLVFTNLVSNALKFTRTRKQAEIEIDSLNHSPAEVVVFVKDNGVGFDMRYRDKLFGVFQRLHSQEAFEGTGIGLATVQRIIHAHGGKVWPESSVDHGATFYVALRKLGKANA